MEPGLTGIGLGKCIEFTTYNMGENGLKTMDGKRFSVLEQVLTGFLVAKFTAFRLPGSPAAGDHWPPTFKTDKRRKLTHFQESECLVEISVKFHVKMLNFI
jgi:hypothetical protein